MADLKYPENLPGPMVSEYSRNDVVGFVDSDVAAGPSFVVPLSEDLPSFHTIKYQFKRGDARKFESWLKSNKMITYAPWFDGPIIHPSWDAQQSQECRYTSNGFPQLSSVTSGGIFTYTAQIMTRSIVVQDDDYETELDALHGVHYGNVNNGANALDEGFNS